MRSQPNREEQLIIDCLKIQGFENIQPEPDGNVPPDILLDGNIAIEVRRMNQNKISGQGYVGLENDYYTLQFLIQEIIRDIADISFSRSAIVGYSYGRPLPEKKFIKRKLSQILEEHKICIDEDKEYDISDSLKIRIIPSTQKLDIQYQFGMSIDYDSGGFVVDLIYDNLKLIVAEKEKKILRYKSKYSEWWLAVVDTIGYGLTDLDAEQFYQKKEIETQFDRILLVSPLDASKYSFLYE